MRGMIGEDEAPPLSLLHRELRHRREIFTAHELHREEHTPVGLADVEDAADRGVRNLPCQPDLVHQPDAGILASLDELAGPDFNPAAVHQDVRKGCFLYFAGAFVVLGIVIAILYFTISSR